MRYDNWESKGATIEDLKDFLKDNYLELITVEKPDSRKFDFIISAKDFVKAKETLKIDYGLILKTDTRKARFWKIVNEKEN